MVHCVLSRFLLESKVKDKRNWEEEYKKLKINFDRLDRMNDVLYRYWYATHKLDEGGEVDIAECIRVSGDVLKYLEGLENEPRKLG